MESGPIDKDKDKDKIDAIERIRNIVKVVFKLKELWGFESIEGVSEATAIIPTVSENKRIVVIDSRESGIIAVKVDKRTDKENPWKSEARIMCSDDEIDLYAGSVPITMVINGKDYQGFFMDQDTYVDGAWSALIDFENMLKEGITTGVISNPVDITMMSTPAKY